MYTQTHTHTHTHKQQQQQQRQGAVSWRPAEVAANLETDLLPDASQQEGAGERRGAGQVQTGGGGGLKLFSSQISGVFQESASPTKSAFCVCVCVCVCVSVSVSVGTGGWVGGVQKRLCARAPPASEEERAGVAGVSKERRCFAGVSAPPASVPSASLDNIPRAHTRPHTRVN